MSRGKKANVFVFTDWHLQAGRKNQTPLNWPPFCDSTPPDPSSLTKIVEDIHRRRDRLLPKDFPAEEKMELRLGGGPEVIESGKKFHWDQVWGVILDRTAVSSETNRQRLTSMAVQLNKTLPVRGGYPIDLFITPRGNEETPAPLKRYEDSFVVQIVDTSEEFSAAVAGALVQSSQRLDQAVVRHVNDLY